MLDKVQPKSKEGLKECNICGYSGSFNLFRIKDHSHSCDYWQCPKCGGVNQHRLIWDVFTRMYDDGFRPLTILDVSPMKCHKEKFDKLTDYYITIDFPKRDGLGSVARADLHQDLTNICFKDKYFDLIICSHITDNIKNDDLAFKELARITKDNGKVFIVNDTFPTKMTREFDEKKKVKWRYYGQNYYKRFESLFGKIEKHKAENQILFVCTK